MPKIAYIDKTFSARTLRTIELANEIITEYQAAGFDLTLRQLYYQFVARALIPNRDSEYKRLGSIINDARLAGLIDWSAISDRTRYVRALTHWRDPAEIARAAVTNYRTDHWEGQAYRPEVWIEKDALVGVIEGLCQEMDMAYLSCRGYTSQSEMWSSAQRMKQVVQGGQIPVVLHLGDHDPSGIDMTRDIEARLRLFVGPIEVRRLALNMDQVSQYGPPPNPAKVTDSRFVGYASVHGEESWELDALEPQVLEDILRTAAESLRDEGTYEGALAEQEEERAEIAGVVDHWEELQSYLKDVYGEELE